MSLGLKPYPAYKDSGVEWLEQVPEHWEVRKLKTLCTRSALYGANVAATSYAESGVRFLRTTDITDDGDLKRGGVFLPADLAQDYLLSDGDVLISRSGTIGRSFLYDSMAHGPCAYAGYLVRFVPGHQVLPVFLFLFTKTQAFAGFLRVMAISSTIDNVNGEKYANVLIPLPPLPEQAAIVRYLDYIDRRIRRYLRSKQKLIKLLEEQKQVIIHEAITGQINVRTGKPYPAYEDFGVEWLGQVPEHWRLVPLKFLSCRIQNGATPPTSESRYYDAGSIPWYGPSSCTMSEEVGEPVRRLADAAFTEGRARLVRGPALLVVVIGATAGRMALLLSDGCTNQQITSFELDTKHAIPTFVLRQIRGAERWLRLTASTATIPILDAGELSRLPVALPPVPEQAAIVRYLDGLRADADSAITHAQREIELLREYRTRLIADVVTGNFDVREVAASLPDEAEEPEPLAEEDVLTDENEVDEQACDEAVFEELEA